MVYKGRMKKLYLSLDYRSKVRAAPNIDAYEGPDKKESGRRQPLQELISNSYFGVLEELPLK